MSSRATRMRMGGHNSRTVLASVIAGIFASTAVGVWYDPSDFSSMYQDSVGSAPVTSVEQPVGLMLDKSKGATRSAELLGNGNFEDGTTGWNPGTGWSVTGGRAEVNNAGAASHITSTTATGSVITVGKFYEITYDVQVTAGAIQMDCGGGTAPAANSPIGPVTRRAIVRATAGFGFRVYGNATAVGWVDNISVKEIPGNHILQSTTTARPVLSARVNRFVATEDFTNTTAWPRSGGAVMNVTGNAFLAPDGTMTGDELVQVAGGSAQAILQQFPDTVVAGTKLVSRVRLRAGTASTAAVTLYNSTDGAHAASSASIISGPGAITGTTFRSVSGLTSEWTTVEIVVDAPIAAKVYRLMVYPNSTGAGVAGQSVGIWGAQMEQNNTASNYQRVNTTTDYNTVGFPLYLRFDGVDDYMITPTAVPMGSISTFDTACAFAREQEAAIGVLIEYGNGALAPDGSFAYFAPLTAGTATNLFRLRGTVTIQNAVAQPFNTSVVMSARAVINSGFVMRYNAGTVATNGTSQAGALTDQQLYIGARAGASLPFKGRFYGFMAIGRRLSLGEMFNAERFLGQKSGVFV